MVSTIQKPPQVLQVGQIFRRIPNEIEDLGKVVQQYKAMKDPLSEAIREWYETFIKALQESKNHRKVITDYMQNLEEILTDPMGGLIDENLKIPLDDEAYLGSDGYTYGSKVLHIFLSEIPPNFHHRSPMNLDDPTPFYVKPHFLARETVKWITRFNQDFRPIAIEPFF